MTAAGWRISYTDPNGNTYVLNNQESEILEREAMEGFDDADKELVESRIPYRHGAVARGDPYAPSRSMSMAIYLAKGTPAEVKERIRELRNTLSPYKASETPGTLVVEDLDNGITRSIAAWCVGTRAIYVAPCDWRMVLHFRSTDAFFYDPTEWQSISSVTGDAGITFPITFPITFGSADIGDTISVENVGDAPTWPTVRINGPGENPSVQNVTTGKKIALTLVLDANDYVRINMEEATVEMYDASAGTTSSVIEALSDDSEFWDLQVDGNTLSVAMEAAALGAVIVSAYWNYLGV